MHDMRRPRPDAKRRHWRWPPLLLALALTGAQPLAADAGELLVLSSTTLDLEAGDTAQEGEVIEVPRDTELTLLAPSGGVLRIEGPWRGRLEGPDAGDGGLISRVVALLSDPAPRRQIGATRSMGGCMPVDLEQDRDVCITGSTCLTLLGPERKSRALTVTGPNASAAEAPLAPDRFGWTWPSGLDLEPGTYRIAGADLDAPVELRLHRQPELPSKAHAAAWMSDVGCTAQAREVLDRLAR